MSVQMSASRAIIATFLGIAVLGAVIAAIVAQRHAEPDQSVNKGSDGNTTSSPPPPARKGLLDADKASELIQSALSERAVVARLALGDIVTIDADDHDRSQAYVALANAGVIELKFCNFPGVAQGPRQVCLAVLTAAAQGYARDPDPAERPFKTIAPSDDRPPPANRRLVDLVVARPRLGHTNPNIRSEGEMRYATYVSAYELTPIAENLGVAADALPTLPNLASFKNTPDGWRLVQIGAR